MSRTMPPAGTAPGRADSTALAISKSTGVCQAWSWPGPPTGLSVSAAMARYEYSGWSSAGTSPGSDEAVDAVGEALVMHDPGGERLVAEGRGPGTTGARVADGRRLAHVVDVDAPRRRADGEVARGVAGRASAYSPRQLSSAAATTAAGSSTRPCGPGDPPAASSSAVASAESDAHAHAGEQLRATPRGWPRSPRAATSRRRATPCAASPAGEVSAGGVIGGPSLSKASAHPAADQNGPRPASRAGTNVTARVGVVSPEASSSRGRRRACQLVRAGGGADSETASQARSSSSG